LKLGPVLFVALLVSAFLCPAGIVLFQRKKAKIKKAH